MTDMVEHPAHYGGEDDLYEVIKVAEAWGFDKNAYLFNVLKYIRRDKGHTLEDLKKAQFYLNRLIERLESVIPAGSITGDKIESRPVLGRPRLHSKLIHVKLPADNAPSYTHYAIHANYDWTVEVLASMVATGAKQKEGSYTISVEESVHRNYSCLVTKIETVAWMLERYPPEHYDYYLRKAS